jgi:hypothetical protein
MAWNPSPHVADCRDIARKWGNLDQVIIIGISPEGQMEMATYGRTPVLCSETKKIGDVAWNAIMKYYA